MGWPYKFISLTADERHARRETLDRYAAYAQLSALLPVALFLFYRLASWARKAVEEGRGGSYGAVPTSPSLKMQRQTAWGAWRIRIGQLRWWLRDDVYIFGQFCGQRDQLLFGSLWTAWLLVLCVVETGHDYLHLTKRFGIIPASQLPILYLMSLKSLNPFVYVFRSSHEEVNRMHRAFGRAIYTILCIHGAFYLNYFIGVGTLGRRFFAPKVFAGVVALTCLTVLSATALRPLRRLSYRLFFITHLIAAFAIPPLLFIHVRPGRLFAGEALIVLVVDLISRKLDTVVSQATLESIPGTSLIKVSAPISHGKVDKFRAHPGSHIYLSVPAAARQSPNPMSISFLLFEFLFNPFTVAAVDEETGELTLVTRRMSGPMSAALTRLAGQKTPGDSSLNASVAAGEQVKIPLCIEGPYGIAKHFPDLVGGEFSRILLIAGGIGATFTVPLYRAITQEHPNAKVEMVWSVRGAADATWAVTGAGAGGSILEDDNVHIFLTGDIVDPAGSPAPTPRSGGSRTRAGGSSGVGSSTTSDVDSGIEMSTMHRDRARNRFTAQHNRRRPDMKKLVDDLFKHGSEERVAIMVCGPENMVRELKEHVGVWVMKGRSIWFHNEGFGL